VTDSLTAGGTYGSDPMKVAIYARYSSDNQRPESIDDQVRACQELAAARGYVVDPAHIYRDEAKSGVLKDRPGLEALLSAARAHQVGAVLVDDCHGCLAITIFCSRFTLISGSMALGSSRALTVSTPTTITPSLASRCGVS
jgi:Resolvase, N terminal domain